MVNMRTFRACITSEMSKKTKDDVISVYTN